MSLKQFELVVTWKLQYTLVKQGRHIDLNLHILVKTTQPPTVSNTGKHSVSMMAKLLMIRLPPT